MPLRLSDLELFLGVVQHASLAQAGDVLHRTPSALSKSIKRIEADLQQPLFDREGKALRLNRAGELLRQRAVQLLGDVEQTRSELQATRATVTARIAGPTVLLLREQARIVARLSSRYADSTMKWMPMFEDEALNALDRGEIDLALVTGAVVAQRGQRWREHWRSDALGSLEMQLAASPRHPLAQKRRLRTEDVLAVDFACPPRSLFCGVRRDSRSDGWRDDQLPRRIRYWVDDVHLLLQLVTDGVALAYLPDFLLRTSRLKRLRLSDCPYRCNEEVFQVWSPSHAHGWLRQLAE